MKKGDHVIPLYTPECRQCPSCLSRKTNLCTAIRATQGQGVMPDGTSRFSVGGEKLHHYMGCSTFANHTVLPEIALAKIREDAPFDKVCYIGCGVTTGVGAVFNTARVEALELANLVEVAGHQAARRPHVAATAKFAREGIHVDGAVGAKGDLDAAGGLPEQERHVHPLDRAGVVDQPLQVVADGFKALVGLRRHRHPADALGGGEGTETGLEQLEAAEGRLAVDLAMEFLGVAPLPDQFGDDLMAEGGRVAESE